MKKLMVAGGALAVFACMGAAPTAISVPAGNTSTFLTSAMETHSFAAPPRCSRFFRMDRM